MNPSTKKIKTRPKKRKASEEDPERLRLKEAHAQAVSPVVFLPDPDSIGVGKFRLEHATAAALQGLFYLVVSKVKSDGVTWGEGGEDRDPRRRMYGFLPQKRAALIDQGIRIQQYREGDGGSRGVQEHQDALELASVDLAFGNGDHDDSVLQLDPCIYAALERVTQRVHSLVPDRYKKYAAMDQLIAVQPNRHNGATYLPAHLDFPRHDGFGVLIVTIGVRGSGIVVLIDEGDQDDAGATSFSFELQEGDAYILSGYARNKCLHGVLCHETSAQRETLNLRYGLHSPQQAYDEIDRHWPE